MKNLTNFSKMVWIRAWRLLYIIWWVVPDTIEHHWQWESLSLLNENHPPPHLPTSPPPHLPDRRRNNWLWTVMLLSSRVCWKKVMFPLKIMLLYGAANLHWATICWNTEGVCLMDVQLYVSLESHNFMVTKSNALSCLGCARNGMCCHVAESICSKYIMFIDCTESTTSSTIIKCFVI